MIAAGLVTYPIVKAGALVPAAAALGGLALLCTVVAILAGGYVAGAATFCLAAEYVLVETTGRVPPSTVIEYAVGRIAFAELLHWSAELPSAGVADHAIALNRARIVAAVSAASIPLALTTLAPIGIRLPGTLELAILGAAASVAVLALAWLSLRRAGQEITLPTA